VFFVSAAMMKHLSALKDICHSLFSKILKYYNSFSTYQYWNRKCTVCDYSEGVRIMEFNATFNNTSAISWQSALLVEKTTDLRQNDLKALES
jgi:hypothetical protein